MIDVRELTDLADLNEAVRIQKEIWGFDDVDLLPLRLFVVAMKIGGQVLGAFDGDKMAGFAVAIPGVKRGGVYWHSHMMGVLPPYRNQGFAQALKFAQRDGALTRGIKLIEWTFDPLELKNAYLNIERLGAVVRRYVLNQYGTTTSHLHAGLPTDRCVAEWHLERERKAAETLAEIRVPADIGDIRRNDQPRARDIQAKVSEDFLRHFAAGLAVTRFLRTPTEGIYQFTQWDSE
jgi:predicted GNAT superfamily acetyltransferase